MLLKYHIQRAIAGSVDHRESYKKQSGGRGKFADIVVTISPQEDPEKTGLEFINTLKVVTFRKNLFLLLRKDLRSYEEWSFSRIPYGCIES